ncbi:MarR family transcriptional regulator [Mycobacterium sp. MYCO198283]|uniref:MarR family winged helix-turn-helix transcriptional regulator n=1 Tax=Mycobacterium sp. MYCO198283 TaxID=2883505 RepID=UPI001E4F3B5D|nr:MarR family transcriptional regulator [Mycobacterium sp. MYCO198283]MCG5432165.1 MarR family transcriptional regulator [Mycobacterium sp. MYCO198283]
MNDDRAGLEDGIAADVRALAAESEEIGRRFCTRNQLSANDFRALQHISVAESAGAPLTAGELSQRLGVTAAAVTYLVERMIASGHIRREPHPVDRRKISLRYTERGLDVASAFFRPLGEHTRRAMADLSDDDLAAAHRVFRAVIDGMRNFQEDLGG